MTFTFGLRTCSLILGMVGLLAGCGGHREATCSSTHRATGPGTYVTVWLKPQTGEETIADLACDLEKLPSVASVFVSPGVPEEPPHFGPTIGPLGPGAIEVSAIGSQDAKRIRAYVRRLSDEFPVADVILTTRS